jgi:hypothetical protein
MKQVSEDSRKVIALKVHQWLRDWDKVTFDSKSFRSRPSPFFYLFTLPASALRALSGIQRRSTEGGLLRSQDMGIQRRHDPSRSKEIRQFIQYGFPWSDLSESKRKSERFNNLRKPGWLPTAIVLNILKPGDTRIKRQVDRRDLITIDEGNVRTAIINLPKNFIGPKWKPHQLPPFEIVLPPLNLDR